MTKKSKNILLLFVLSSVILFLGLAAYYVEQRVSFFALGFSLLGLSSLIVCLICLKNEGRFSVLAGRGRQFYLLIIFIGLLSILWVQINCLGYYYNRRFDLTKFKQHTLTEESKDVINELKQNIKVTAFYVGISPKYLEDLLKEYEGAAQGKITTEIIDPLVQISYAAQFGNVISGQERKVIIQSGKERRDVEFSDETPLTEEELNNAIIRVTRKARHAYFFMGHGEYSFMDESDTGLSTIAKLLLANNVISHRLLLGVDKKIPNDCDVLVIPGPKQELSVDEEKIINEYLEKGGDALFLIENVVVTTPDVPLTEDQRYKNPSLNSILNKWGVKIGDDIVVDLANHAGDDVGSPATRNYVSHKAMIKNLDYTFYVRPRSISLLSNRRPTLKAAPFVLTSSKETSWGETNRHLEVKYDEGIDRPGPVAISYVIWKPKEKDGHSDTRTIVFTDADFLTNIYIDQYSNAQMGLNVINWLTEMDYKVLRNKKEMKVERLDLTSQQRRVVVVILWVIPCAILMIGLMVWMKQRIE